VPSKMLLCSMCATTTTNSSYPQLKKTPMPLLHRCAAKFKFYVCHCMNNGIAVILADINAWTVVAHIDSSSIS